MGVQGNLTASDPGLETIRHLLTTFHVQSPVGIPIQESGVMLVDLMPASVVGDNLLDRPDDARSQTRMKTLDALNDRFGRRTITNGTTGRGKAGMEH